MGVIPVKPSKNLAERIGTWFSGLDFSSFAEELDPADSVVEVLNLDLYLGRPGNLNQSQAKELLKFDSTFPTSLFDFLLGVSDVNYYHSANLVLLLFFLHQTHFIFHLSIVPFYPLYRDVNPFKRPRLSTPSRSQSPLLPHILFTHISISEFT